MITNYNDFVDNKINEANFFTSLKNLFGKLLQNISDELKKPVDELTNKLSKTKDVKQIKTIIANYLKVHNNTLTTELKNVKTMQDLKKVVLENIKAIYASIVAQVQSLGEENYSFSEIFADAPASMKKLFDKNEKNFNKYVEPFVIDLIILQAKPFGYKEDDIRNQLKTTNESIDIIEYHKLFEQEEQKTPETPGEEQTNPTDNKPEDKNNPTEQPQTEEDKKKAEEDKKNAANFEKLKTAMKKWFDNSIYRRVNEALKKDIKTPTEAVTTDLQDKIKNMQSTKNVDSVNKIIDTMTTTDKQKLMQIRDLLGLDKNSAPL